MEENGIERTDKASFLHPTPKYPAGPKYPALSIPLNTKLGKNPLALGHGTAWDHYKMENFLHPTLNLLIPQNTQLGEILWLWDMGQHGTSIKWKTFSILPKKYPAAPKYQALSIPLNTKLGKNPLALGHGTAWDHYKMENFLHPTLKYLAAPKIPSSVDTPKYPAWRNLLALGHGTAWDQYKMENFLHPTKKIPSCPKIPSFVDTPKCPAWRNPLALGHDRMGPL